MDVVQQIYDPKFYTFNGGVYANENTIDAPTMKSIFPGVKSGSYIGITINGDVYDFSTGNRASYGFRALNIFSDKKGHDILLQSGNVIGMESVVESSELQEQDMVIMTGVYVFGQRNKVLISDKLYIYFPFYMETYNFNIPHSDIDLVREDVFVTIHGNIYVPFKDRRNNIHEVVHVELPFKAIDAGRIRYPPRYISDDRNGYDTYLVVSEKYNLHRVNVTREKTEHHQINNEKLNLHVKELISVGHDGEIQYIGVILFDNSIVKVNEDDSITRSEDFYHMQFSKKI